MKNFSIPEPCSENWNEMTPTDKGAFCQKCAHEVHDVSQMTNQQIRGLFLENLGKRTCVKMTLGQEVSMNNDFTQWQLSNKANLQRAMVFSLLVVFGLSLFSCNNPQQVKELHDLQRIANSVIPIAENELVNERSITIETLENSIESYPQVVQQVQHDYRLGQAVEFTEIEIEPNVDLTQNEYVTMEQMYYTKGVSMMDIQYVKFAMEEGYSEFILENGRDAKLTFSALAFPNPVITDTRLEVIIPENTKNLEITLMDLNGRILEKVNNSEAEAGTHNFEIGMQELKPAIYLVDVRYNDTHEVVRIVKSN